VLQIGGMARLLQKKSSERGPTIDVGTTIRVLIIGIPVWLNRKPLMTC
jgi:hypothetical protein